MSKIIKLLILLIIASTSHAQANSEFSYKKENIVNKEASYYEVTVEYPQITDLRIVENTKKDINQKIRNHVHGLFDKELKRFISTSKSIKDDLELTSSDSIDITFSIIRFDEKIISIKFVKCFYEMGAAHGLEDITVFNYDVKRKRIIKLKDLFDRKGSYLVQISDYCINDLTKQLKMKVNNSVDEAWIEDGASPDKKSLSIFGIKNNALVMYFNVYQVACYAVGSQEVVIPFEKLEGIKADLIK